MRFTLYFILGLFLIHTCTGFQNLGCFYDYLENRTLPGLNACNLPEAEEMCNECTSEHPYCESTQSMTVAFCTDLCHRRGFLYSGLEAGNQCFCGNNFNEMNPPNGKPPNNYNCTEPCSGDSSQFCGGELRIIIYKNDDFMNCSTPTDFSNGTVTPKQDVYASGTTVNLTCNDGFYQVGPTNSYCWYSGEFSHVPKDVQPTCIRECPELNTDSFAEVSRIVQYPGFFIVGDTITYKCSEGYESVSGVSNGDLECREDRLWTESLPICSGVSCGDPGTPNQGILVGEKFFYPHSVKYECQPGYTIIGSATRTCHSNKTWSGTLPSCSPVSCGDPGSIINGMKMGADQTYGSTVTYVCYTGYNLVGAANVTCQSDGTWTQSAPVCQIVNCGTVSVGEGVFINGGIFTYNEVLMFICDTGYNKVSGNTTRRCQADGNWSGNDFVCEIVDCMHPGSPPEVTVVVNETTYGAIVMYTCAQGYSISSGNNWRTCGADGSWTGIEPTCSVNSCGEPSTPEFSIRTGSNYDVGGIVNYTCMMGYEQTAGNSSITCTPNGTWSGETIVCSVVNCEDPGTPQNGLQTATDLTYQGSVSFECNTGYNLIGSASITCQSDKTWSDIVPTCQKLTTIQQTTVHRTTTADRIITTLNPTTTQQRTTKRPTTIGEQQTTAKILTTKLTPNPTTQHPITTGKQQTTVEILRTNINFPTVRHTTAAIPTPENQQTTSIVSNKGGINDTLQETSGFSEYLLYIVAGIVVLLILILVLGATYILSSRRRKREPLTKSSSIEAIPNPAYVDGFAETPNAATNEGFEMAEENEVEPASPTSNGSAPTESGNDATDGWTPIGHLESETSGGKFKPTFMAK